MATDDAFAFAGERCDRITARVMARLHEFSRAAAEARAFPNPQEIEMSFFAFANGPVLRPNRREFLTKSGLVLSGTAVALMAGQDALAKAGGKATEDDVKILNSALASELEAIAAYQVGAESGLLQKPCSISPSLPVASQGARAGARRHDREARRQARAAKAKYDFPVETLKTQNDVLRFAASLEKGAVSAYLGAVPSSRDRDLARRGEHPRRRGDALGDPAQRRGEAPVPAAFVVGSRPLSPPLGV
jgi:hypothetical protein